MIPELPLSEPTVVCVLRSGGIYTPEWVLRLKREVRQHLKTPHRFACFTDMDIRGVDCLALRFEWPGWWSKIELFRWNAGCRMLYLDLDVRIVGGLDDILHFPAPMVLAPAIVTKPKPRIVRRYQSSVMAWTPPEGRIIFSQFLQCPELRMQEWRGDQDFIGHIKPDCATFPAGWITKRETPSTRVVINDKRGPGKEQPGVQAA